MKLENLLELMVDGQEIELFLDGYSKAFGDKDSEEITKFQDRKVIEVFAEENCLIIGIEGE